MSIVIVIVTRTVRDRDTIVPYHIFTMRSQNPSPRLRNHPQEELSRYLIVGLFVLSLVLALRVSFPATVSGHVLWGDSPHPSSTQRPIAATLPTPPRPPLRQNNTPIPSFSSGTTGAGVTNQILDRPMQNRRSTFSFEEEAVTTTLPETTTIHIPQSSPVVHTLPLDTATSAGDYIARVQRSIGTP